MNIRILKSARWDGHTQMMPSPPHAEVPVRQAVGQLGQAGRRTGHAVEKNVVVPQAVHFGKAHRLPLLTGEPMRFGLTVMQRVFRLEQF